MFYINNTIINTKYISEAITEEVIETWTPADTIVIVAGMGKGKTTWVLDTLCKYYKNQNENVLFLSSRHPLKMQMRMQAGKSKDNNITVMSYQEINKLLADTYTKEDMIYNLNSYGAIVCDEFHYWIADSSFVSDTELSYQAIMHETNVQKIMLSATPEDIISYMKKDNISLQIYSANVEYKTASRICFFNQDDTIDKLLQDSISNGIKTAVFVRKAEQAFSLYQKYQDHSSLITSSKTYKDYVEDGVKNQITLSEKFQSLILISTMTMEVGVSLKDKELQRIIINTFDPFSVVQCAGRKRMKNDSDKAELFIFEPSRCSINGERHIYNKWLRDYSEFENNPYDFINTHNRNEYTCGGIIIPTANSNSKRFDWAVNNLRLHYIESALNRIMLIQESNYHDVILDYLNPVGETDIIFLYEKYFMVDKIENLLQGNEYRIFLKEERKVLIDLLNVKSGGRQRTSRKALNNYLKTLPVPFVIDTCDYYDCAGKRHRGEWKLQKI